VHFTPSVHFHSKCSFSLWFHSKSSFSQVLIFTPSASSAHFHSRAHFHSKCSFFFSQAYSLQVFFPTYCLEKNSLDHAYAYCLREISLDHVHGENPLFEEETMESKRKLLFHRRNSSRKRIRSVDCPLIVKPQR